MNKEIKDLIIVFSIPFILIIILNICFLGLSCDGMIIPKTNIAEILIVYLFFGILFCITKKSNTAILILAILLITLLDCNLIKIYVTSEPITINDFQFIFQIFSIGKLVPSNLPSNVKYLLIGEIFFLSFLHILLKKHLVKIENTRYRISILIICLLLLVMTFLPFEYSTKFLLNVLYNNNDVKDYASYTTNYDFYSRYGLIGGIYGNMLLNRNFKPENYNEEEVKSILNTFDENIDKELIGKPNIIMISSEAFWNISKMDEISFNINPIEKYEELKKYGKTLNILVPSFGGMSENVSMEILTGEKMNYFANGYIPIMSLYNNNNNNNSSRIPSLVKELNQNGYNSKIIFGRDYYNSEETYKKIGFNEYIDYYKTDDYEDKNIRGIFLSDKYMVNKLIEDLNNKEKDSKVFYMISTIENHMPYNKEKFEDYDVEITESILQPKEQEQLLAYSQGLYDASNELKRLYEFIETYEEPTIIVFYGDHLPYLYNDKNEPLINDIMYFNTQNKKVNLLRQYSTEALILSNYNIDLSKIPNNLGADMLLNSIMNNMDINLSTYYKWLYKTKNVIPCYNKYIFLDPTNKIYYFNELNEEMRKIYTNRKNIQYYFNFSK